MLSVLADEPRNPCELRADLSPELGRIAMRCLEREPERRFSNPRELAEALQSRSGSDTAASESRLAGLLAEHFAPERIADDELAGAVAAAEVSLPRTPPEPPGARAAGGFRPRFLLLMLAIAVLIAVWALAIAIGRGA